MTYGRMISVVSGKTYFRYIKLINFGIFTLFRLSQPWKAEIPMVSTESGIVTLVRREQFLKASSPIDVTELGRVMLVRLEQFSKA